MYNWKPFIALVTGLLFPVFSKISYYPYLLKKKILISAFNWCLTIQLSLSVEIYNLRSSLFTGFDPRWLGNWAGLSGPYFLIVTVQS